MSVRNNPDADFWRGKRVLITGHTGFKGSWLTLWLSGRGADVAGISLPPATRPNLFSLAKVDQACDSHLCDIRNHESLAFLIKQISPEIVFHLAAQPLVRASYREPLQTFATNIQGTTHVLDALRPLDLVRVVVAVTTDKVYQNQEHPWPYRETDALGGHDPYSASKAASEIVIASYRKAYFAEKQVAVSSARAGNVIGGGDWSEDRLIPDAVRAWQAGQPLPVRRPNAIRPWQHVLEPLSGYIKLAERLWQQPQLAGAYNFGPVTHEAVTVREVVQQARIGHGSGEIIWGDGTEGAHEAGCLALETAKARTILGVEPRWPLNDAIQRTMKWYRHQHDGVDARSLCQIDIEAFEADYERETR